MEYKIIKRKINEEEVFYLDITEEFVRRFGKCFAPIESVGVELGNISTEEIDLEEMEILYKGIFSLPDYLSIFNDDSNRLVTYGYESLLYGISIKIIFQNKEILDISAEMMIADTQFEKEEYPITIHKESSEIPEIKKVAFTFGMYNDYMLILTDAPKSAIEDWAREYTKGLEDNNNVYFKPLQKNYYVKIIADSEIHDLSWEDVETIGFNEVYDLGDYMENNKE